MWSTLSTQMHVGHPHRSDAGPSSVLKRWATLAAEEILMAPPFLVRGEFAFHFAECIYPDPKSCRCQVPDFNFYRDQVKTYLILEVGLSGDGSAVRVHEDLSSVRSTCVKNQTGGSWHYWPAS